MARPVHFEIHAPDPAKSMAFYEQNFGWKFSKFAGPVEYWVVKTGEGPGIDGGLMKSKDGQGRTINTLQVQNVDESLKKALASGATLALAKMAIPGVGWLAYIMDPGGNIVGMMHPDPNAK